MSRRTSYGCGKTKGNSFRNLFFKNENKVYCWICFTPLTYESSTIDHIIPLAYGGKNRQSNYLLACAPCNTERGKENWLNKKYFYCQSTCNQCNEYHKNLPCSLGKT